jgi:hypothetical protein
MKRCLSISFIFLCCLCSNAFAATNSEKLQCSKDARDTRNTAIRSAQTAYQDALTGCRGPCFEACKTTFESCVGPFNATAKQCITDAETAFAASFTACQTSTSCGTPKQCYANRDFQLCLVDPRVLRRTTVQACNKAEKEGIKTAACFANRKACNKACEPAK